MGWVMLKKRIIPIELLNDDRLVKSINFSSFRDVGDPIKSSQIYSDQDADELMIVNVSRTKRNTENLIKTVKKISQNCFVPVTTGGGIVSEIDAANLFEAGTDKVLVNSIVFKKPQVISKIAARYGQQAIVVGIDIKRINERIFLLSNCGQNIENISLEKHIQTAINAGAGEIFVQSIDHDGKMNGYELEILNSVVTFSSVPVIIAGGAGNFSHLKEAFDEGADATACGSLFNFGDNNPLRAKAFLKNHKIPLKRI